MRKWLGAICVILAYSSIAHAQRPEPGDGYAPDLTLQSLPSPGGGFRIWYVQDSVDAVVADDSNPADGVPDFVADLALTADNVHAYFIDTLGFRPPLVDSEHLAPELVGGDGRFDIYLKNFITSDGSYQTDGCLSPQRWCYGYFLMENDFVGSSYPSLQIAADVLVSHEYFHAIQAAYGTGIDSKWTEGSAVWAEEKYNPEQEDFERLIGSFLMRPWRPFDRTTGAAFDGWAYGAGLWPWFLDKRYGEEIVLEIWEGLDGNINPEPDLLDVTDEILRQQYDSSLREAWIEFSQWNFFTGSRTDARAYQGAEDWPEVALEPIVLTTGELGLFSVQQQTEGMSARYTPIQLADLGGEERELVVETAMGEAAVATAYLWDQTISEAIELVPDTDDSARARATFSWTGTPLLIVVVTGVSRGASQRTVHLSLSEVPVIPEKPGVSDTGGCSTSGSPRPTNLVFWGLFTLASVVVIRRPKTLMRLPASQENQLPN